MLASLFFTIHRHTKKGERRALNFFSEPKLLSTSILRHTRLCLSFCGCRFFSLNKSLYVFDTMKCVIFCLSGPKCIWCSDPVTKIEVGPSLAAPMYTTVLVSGIECKAAASDVPFVSVLNLVATQSFF